MTWKDFTTAVEAQGITDDDEIDWIDVSGWRPLLVQHYNEQTRGYTFGRGIGSSIISWDNERIWSESWGGIRVLI